MHRYWSLFRNVRWSAIFLGLAALAQAPSLAAQQVTVTSPNATTVWKYNDPGCGFTVGSTFYADYSDVPARPFLVGDLSSPTVLWFAANSNGSFASVGTSPPPDVLAGFQRGTANGPGCVSWLQPTSYPNSTPASYDTGLWMVAPFTPDGINVQALVHNEFHGEWTGNISSCWQQGSQQIYMPCNYWNIVSASSSDAGQGFQLRQQQGAAGTNVPAIVLGQAYQAPPKSSPSNVPPHGVTAQSNILQVGQYYYVLVQQLPYVGLGVPASLEGVCIYQAPVPPTPGAPLTWMGWNGGGYNVPVAGSYPVGGQMPFCWLVLGEPFRFSWSLNTVLNQLIIIGQDMTAGLKANGVNLDNCPYAPGVSATTTDSAFVYRTATLSSTGQLQLAQAETCLLQTLSINTWAGNKTLTGQAYPSLLDPLSPTLAPGDRNFQHSGQLPFLYFTQLNPTGNPGYDRDVVRMPLLVTPENTAR